MAFGVPPRGGKSRRFISNKNPDVPKGNDSRDVNRNGRAYEKVVDARNVERSRPLTPRQYAAAVASVVMSDPGVQKAATDFVVKKTKDIFKGGDDMSRRKRSSDSGGNGFTIPQSTRNAELTFRTNIPSNLVVDEFPQDRLGWSPLFTMDGTFLPNDQNTMVRTFMNRYLHDRYITTVQERVNYNITGLLSEDKLFSYLCAVTDGLQAYYTIHAVINYTNNQNNYNDGMNSIRRQMSASFLGVFNNLEATLLNRAIPVNLHNFINYMYQNFSHSENPRAAICRLEYKSLLTLLSAGFDEDAQEIIEGIINRLLSFSQEASVLRKAYPEMVFSQLNESTDSALYDKNFLSFWANSVVTYDPTGEDTLDYVKTVGGYDSPFEYYAQTDDGDVDGLFFACFSIGRSTGTGVIPEPGLWAPKWDYNYDNFSIDRNASIREFRDGSLYSLRDSSPAQSGVIRFAYFVNGQYEFDEEITTRSVKSITSNLRTVEQSVAASIDYLFNPNTTYS